MERREREEDVLRAAPAVEELEVGARGLEVERGERRDVTMKDGVSLVSTSAEWNLPHSFTALVSCS